MKDQTVAPRRQRGVSLIEAMVALAAMGIGMLGLVGVQSSLRSNADLSKQRSEAIRIAQESVESARAFVSFSGTTPAFSELVDGSVSASVNGSSATFTRTRDIAELAGVVPAKVVKVTVTWADRAGEAQKVTLSTVVTGIAPELAATLVVPGEGDVIRQPQGRHRGIPVIARTLPDAPGYSAMIPPGSPGVAWRFDNVSGLITLCTTSAATTAALTSANMTCAVTGDNAILLAGYVRYALTPTQPTAADAANPTSAPPVPAFIPRVTYTNNASGSGTVICKIGGPAYYCAVPVAIVTPFVAPSWSGTVSFDTGPHVIAAGTDSTTYRVCRYGASVGAYSNVTAPLINQNYLVIPSGDRSPLVTTGGNAFTCPSPTVAFIPT